MNPQLWIWIALATTLLGGLFSALHLSLRRVSRSALESRAAAKGPRAVEAARRILEDTDGHAIAVAFPRTLLHMAALVFLILWIDSLTGGEGPGALERSVGVVSAAVVVWLVGVVAAHAIARHGAESVVLAFASLARGSYLMLRPLSPLTRFIDEVVRRLAGGNDRTRTVDGIEAELLSIVEDREREGNIDETEREMIEAVVEFRTKTVEQIMTPRTEVKALEYTDDLREVHEFLRTSGHSRIPVYRENLDHIVGMLYAKDLLNELAGRLTGSAGKGAGGGPGGGETLRLSTFLREAVFVPETKTVRELLSDLIAKKVHVAMVADEYGGTAGLITVEDILEEIVGEIRDEYESEADAEPAIEVDEEARAAVIEARAYIDDVNDELKTLGARIPTSEDYDTFGGFVVVTLGRIPEAGESFRHGDLMVRVLEAEPTRVSLARVEIRPEADEPDEGEEALAAAESPRGVADERSEAAD